MAKVEALVIKSKIREFVKKLDTIREITSVAEEVEIELEKNLEEDQNHLKAILEGV